jgi:hypothetical protein
MAERPVFIPAPDAPGLVTEKSLTITWAGGFAAVQKKKNVKALHNAAEAIGIGPILEASTKSDEKLGQHLSAFHLKVKTVEGELPLECVYQGSKVFERGGPYTDLYFADARSAKRDPRLLESGRLVAFVFEGHKFPLEPKTVFYDWLYITAIFPHRDWLDRLSRYAGFSDIEFNPQRSINCQARSLALFVSLKATCLLDEAIRSPESFIETMRQAKRRPVGAVAEAPTVAEISSSAQPERMLLAAVKAERSQQTPAEQSMTVTPAPAELLGRPVEEAALAAPTATAEAVVPGPITPVSVSEPKRPPPDFETFLLERALRKPKNPGRTSRKRGAGKREIGRQTPLPGHAR